MAKNNFIYSSFISGEISPKFFGRVDTQQYNQSCEELRNMLIYPQGGAGRRPGTISKLHLLKSDGVSAVNKCRLIPFQSTDGSRWQIMITDEDPTGALVNIAGTLTAPWRVINVTDGSIQNLTTYNNSPLYTPYHGGPDVSDSNRAGEWDFSATGKDLQLNEIQFSQSGDTIILSHGSFRPIVIVYDPNRTTDSQFFFNGYINLFATPSELLGNGITTRGKAMPFLDPGNTINDITLHVNTGTGDFYLTSSAVTFDSTWEGRWLKLQNTLSTSVEIYAKKWNSGTGHLDCVYIRGNVLSTNTYVYGPTTSGSSWTQGEWNDTFGWPKCVAFFDSRLVFGGSKLFPDKEWFSEIDNAFLMDGIGLVSDSDFLTAIVASDPFEITLKETTYSEIRWMNPKKTLTTGTNAAEFIVQGPDSTQSIGPTNSSNNVETPYGSAPVQAVGYENTVVFLSRNRKSLHEMVYDLAENSFIAPDLNIISEHIVNKAALERIDQSYAYAVTPGAFVALTRQMTPYGMVWALDNNGCLASLTRDRNQNVAAWHFHEIVGPGVHVNGDAFDFRPQVVSISAIQKRPLDAVGTGGEPDEIWLAVKRGYIDQSLFGQNPRIDMFIEKMALDWDRGAIGKNWDDTLDVAPVYMDAAIIFNSNDNPAVESEGIIPVPHMITGQIASVIMDGFDLGEFTVNSNYEIDISAFLDEDRKSGDTNWQAVVGFNYVARLNPIVAEAQAQLGSSQGQPRRIDQLTINFYRSLGVRFGKVASTEETNTPIDDLEDILFPEPLDLTTPQQTYSGSKTVVFPQGYETRPRILVESFRPLPCVITYIVARQVVYEQ